MKNDPEFTSLISQLISIGEKYKGKQYKDTERIRYWYAEGLYLRFVNYCCSIRHLKNGTVNPVIIGERFLDPGSINVLCRAALESFLVLHYVFIEPSELDEQELRYLIWLRQGLIIRTKQEPILPELKEPFIECQKEDDKLEKRIEENELFKKLNSKTRQMILSVRDWRIPIKKNKNYRYPSYSDIATNAGFPSDIAQINYDFLSGYTHSGSLSTRQVHLAKSENDKITICNTSITLVKFICPIISNSYDELMSRVTFD